MKILIFAFLMFASWDGFSQEKIGGSCSSDLQCESLCCNSSTGACAPHDPTGKTPIFCNKNWGETCVTSEFCASEAITKCKLVKTGISNGVVTCALRCPTEMVHGRCIDNYCAPPVQPPVPNLDPNDCSQAVDP